MDYAFQASTFLQLSVFMVDSKSPLLGSMADCCSIGRLANVNQVNVNSC